MTDLPLTFAQEQLWFIDEFHHGLAAHNVANLVRLRGPLDAGALGRSLDAIVARHEALRTRLVAGDDGRGACVIDPPAPAGLELTDYSGLGAQAATRFAEYAAEQAARPFQLARDRLIRASLVKLAADEHVLLVVAHQTIFDDSSFGVLLRELAALYQAHTGGAGLAPARPATQFADYARWERDRLRGSALTELESYWRDALDGFETSQFPVDRPRPLFASHDGAAQTTVIDPELLDDLRALGRREGTTLDVLLLAAVQALLQRYTGQTDVVVGLADANRARPELAGLVGFVEAMLPVRCDLAGDPTFTELLGRVRAAAGGARAHRDLPFAKIVQTLRIDRDTGRFPVFQIAVACPEPIADISSAGVTFHREHAYLPAARYDIAVLAEPGPAGLWLRITYPPALFDDATVRRLAGHLAALLRGAAADPAARLSALPVLTGPELRQELTEWNDTAMAFPVQCIHQGFEEQVARTPAAVAAEYEGERVSYAELNRQANQIARRLRELGVGAETLAGVCMTTGPRRLAALLGVWKAGGGYVPLDPGLPADRLSFMITDTAMSVIITDRRSGASVPADAAARVLALDDEWDLIMSADGTNLAGQGATPASVAYVIYTSGSTGQPKGVVVEHRQAINFLHGMVRAWRITPASAVLQFAAFTFDVSVMDMFMPLLAGARVVLAPARALHSPPRLAALIRDRKITFACLPPAVLTLLTGEDFPDLQTLLSAGEELTSELLRSWLRDGLEIYNGYGPTEASIGSTFMRLDASTPLPPPIGRPKPNYRAYVLDPQLNPVPVGVTGELHIGGAGVARGYLNRPDLTEQRFIADPFTPGQRLYKTGDLVRRRPDGTLVFVGRIDNQVKIRGLRIELGEIETALAAHPGVAQAVVTVVASPAGEKQLAAYLRAADGAELTIAEVRQHLASALPAYMIPGHLIALDELPLTAHGKIDKAALPAPDTARAGTDPVPPGTLIEAVVADLYATVLGNEYVGATDSFFDAGGSSLQAMQLITALRAALAVDLDVSAVFINPTPRQLAALLRTEHGFDDTDLGPDGIDGIAELPRDEPGAAARVTASR
jgi:amino acid adenylation domain-containing protein